MLVCVCVCACTVCVVNATYGSMGGAGVKYNIFNYKTKLRYSPWSHWLMLQWGD